MRRTPWLAKTATTIISISDPRRAGSTRPRSTGTLVFDRMITARWLARSMAMAEQNPAVAPPWLVTVRPATSAVFQA